MNTNLSFPLVREQAGTVATDIATEMAIDLLTTVGYKAEDEDDLLDEVADELQTTLTMALARSSRLREFIGSALVADKQKRDASKKAAPADPGPASDPGLVADQYGIVPMIAESGVKCHTVVVFDWENGTVEPLAAPDSEHEALALIEEQYAQQRRMGQR